MPHSTFWHTYPTVAYIKMSGTITEAELNDAAIELRDKYLSIGKKPIHIICDLQDVTSYPHNAYHVEQATHIYLQHPSMGWLILLGFNNVFVQFLENVVAQNMGSSFEHATTMDEAEQILFHIDPQLGNLIEEAS